MQNVCSLDPNFNFWDFILKLYFHKYLKIHKIFSETLLQWKITNFKACQRGLIKLCYNECHRTKINDVDLYVLTLKDMPKIHFILLNKKKQVAESIL